MARIVPDGWREFATGSALAGAAGAAVQRHHDTLALLAAAGLGWLLGTAIVIATGGMAP